MIKEFASTGTSTTTNSLGMREMQQRAYEVRDEQYILIKAPPASGKSRALMFLGLHKVKKQKLKKVIVAVPEKSIGASFAETKLTEFGFYADWKPDVNLCTSASSTSKVEALMAFLKSDQQYLVCTHATLRFAFKKSDVSDYDDCLLAIDEFHHVSVSEDNILGDTLRQIMADSNAHIIAMTGSYFRGDRIDKSRDYGDCDTPYTMDVNSIKFNADFLGCISVEGRSKNDFFLSGILEELYPEEKAKSKFLGIDFSRDSDNIIKKFFNDLKAVHAFGKYDFKAEHACDWDDSKDWNLIRSSEDYHKASTSHLDSLQYGRYYTTERLGIDFPKSEKGSRWDTEWPRRKTRKRT